jgi:glucosamine-6-phosphate deaminase
MRLVVKEGYSEVSIFVARYLRDAIFSFDPGSGRPFALGLPTGSTPLGAYRELVRLHREESLSFRDVVTFNMDEYLGLGPDSPQSYHRFMAENLFSLVDLPASQAHILDGMAKDPEAECLAYEEAIRAAGGIGLFLAGIGPDGHLAFNEPGSSLASRTRVKTLAEDTRAANARYFGGDPGAVPRAALTVGLGTVMDAREVLLVAVGRAKAKALRDAVEGGVSQMCPASCLQLHPRVTVACDPEAACELRVGTLRYFAQAAAAEGL